MIAMGCDNDQPMDLSIGFRDETPVRNYDQKTFLEDSVFPKQENPDYLTPVSSFSSSSSTSQFRPSPSVPEPPSKRSFDDMQSEFWYATTPPVSSASSSKHCAPSTSSPSLSVKRARLHSPERNKFILDFNRFSEPLSPPSSRERNRSPLLPPEFKIPTMTRIPKSPRVRTSREKSPLSPSGANQSQGDSPLNGYIPSYRSVRNFPAYSDELQPSFTPSMKMSDGPASYLQEIMRNNGLQTNLLEAWQTVKNVHSARHQEDHNSPFPMGTMFNQSRRPDLDVPLLARGAPTNNAADNKYQTYKYLNYLQYLLYGKAEEDRQRLGSARELDHPGHDTSSRQRDVSSSLKNVYLSYLTSLLTASEHQPTIHPETPLASQLTPSTTVPSSTSTSNLINSHPFLFGQSQSPIASSSSFSSHVISPRGKHPKKTSNLSDHEASTSWGASTFRPGFLYPEPSSNHRFANFPFLPTKKPFVRASSFDENLIRSQTNFGSAEKMLDTDFCDKESFARFGSSSRDNYNLFRTHSSLPNIPINALESSQRSLEHNVDLSGVGDLLSKLADKPFPESKRETTHRRNDFQNKNINMINIHNFNNIKDLYSINNVHKLIQGNISEIYSNREPSETNSEARDSSPDLHPELAKSDSEAIKLSQSSTSAAASNLDAATEIEDSESSSSSAVCVRKKPSRALTGRHVRSGTGASISTLASLREILKERRNKVVPSTPTSSRSTSRGCTRRRQLAL